MHFMLVQGAIFWKLETKSRELGGNTFAIRNYAHLQVMKSKAPNGSTFPTWKWQNYGETNLWPMDM